AREPLARDRFVVAHEDAQALAHDRPRGSLIAFGSITVARVLPPTSTISRRAFPSYASASRFLTIGSPCPPSRGPENFPGFSVSLRGAFFPSFLPPGARRTRSATSPRCPAEGPCFIAFSASGRRIIGGTLTSGSGSGRSRARTKRFASRIPWSDQSV